MHTPFAGGEVVRERPILFLVFLRRASEGLFHVTGGGAEFRAVIEVVDELVLIAKLIVLSHGGKPIEGQIILVIELSPKALALIGELTHLDGYAPVMVGTGKGAENGNADAQNELGLMYATGRTTQRSPAKAFEWTEKAAEQNNRSAIYNLGTFYERGCGCEVNFEYASLLYLKAASMGMPEAAYSLGHLYHEGKGVEKDPAKAFLLCRTAAEEGYAKAVYDTAVLYLYGDGTERDLGKAKKYFQRAFELGFVKARDNIRMIEEEERRAQ